MKVIISKPYKYKGALRCSGISLIDDQNSGVYMFNNFKTAIIGCLSGFGYKIKRIDGNLLEVRIDNLDSFENILRLNNIRYEVSNESLIS